MSSLHNHFHSVAGSPKPHALHSLFGGTNAGGSYTSNISQLLQHLIGQVDSQNAVVSSLIGKITGQGGGGSALEKLFGGGGFGGSILGGVASAAKGGFSWRSILKDLFPVGGLISGIAGLFSSAPTPPPLNQYDAPHALNFSAVLNANGSLSQGSADQYGYTRASSPGLDLLDAQGGPYSPYQRAAHGSLLPVAGDPTSRYSGTLNLPEMNLQAMLQPLVQISPNGNGNQAAGNASVYGQNTVGAEGVGTAPTAPRLSTSNSSLTADPTNQTPSFDQQWFNEHGNMIASAVRTELLNFHPIVDVINNL